jgi:type VI secretion system Hcp family effector
MNASRIFLKLEGGPAIDGQSRDKGFEKLIECDSASHGLAQAGYYAGGQLTGGSVNLGDFQISKKLDQTSPQLAEYCCSAQKFDKATIQYAAQINNKLQAFYEVILSPVIISGVNGGGDAESISLRFHKVEWKYTPFIDNKAGTPTIGKWDADVSGNG